MTDQQLFPLTPIFDVDKSTGAIDIGNTPSSVYVPPFVSVDLIWNSSSASEPSPHVPTTNVVVGDLLIIGSNYRDIGDAGLVAPTLSGTATTSALSLLGAKRRYDTLGVSDGHAALWEATVLTSGTLTVSITTANRLPWIWVLRNYSLVAQSVRHTADGTPSVSISLATAPTGPVIGIVQYGGASGSGNQWTTPAPSGWTFYQARGNFSSYTKHVSTFYAIAQQTATFTMPASSVQDGGRDVFLLELAV